MFPDLGEFRLIKGILEKSLPLEKKGPEFRDWLPVGDDAAEFDGWLATKDLSVEGTHFCLDWSTPEQAVEKHIVSNVSDISAMGGRPRLALFGLCVGKSWSEDTVRRVSAAVAEGFAKRNIALVGGDTVSGDVGMFSTTLIGEQVAKTRLLRSGARAGDRLFVSGTLGRSVAGLWLLQNRPAGFEAFQDLIQYHLSPSIREDLGARLASTGVCYGALDISDGLSSELNHLALSSGVSLVVEANRIPVDPRVSEMCSRYGLNPMDFVMDGGEEYVLLFTVSAKNDIFSVRGFPDGVYEIGSVQEGTGVYMLEEGKKKIVKAQAWSHL
ncbi:thiamine-phosphate kinase [Fibrobacter sp.]|uniref:thiamine-phosphate kinase n=1 Tax=Fibrobacter sp. TaxID=35828 RepID=UPI00388FE79D